MERGKKLDEKWIKKGQAMKNLRYAEIAHKDYCIARRRENELIEQLDGTEDPDERYKIFEELELLKEKINTYARLIVTYVFGDEI